LAKPTPKIGETRWFSVKKQGNTFANNHLANNLANNQQANNHPLKLTGIIYGE
jgi:hypothetical protein